eukprot:Skav212939  [mRNA]  locus=scaffold374:464240:467185:- [translate_table: standard]
MRGPPPVRMREHVWGFPWLTGRLATEAELGSALVRVAIDVWTAVAQVPISSDGYLVFMFGEHPEDLGLVVREEDRLMITPASIWQLSQVRNLLNLSPHISTVAINQCCWGTPWRKPTRLLTTSAVVKAWGPNEWPSFDEHGRYAGPLNRSCGCQVNTHLARTSNEEAFRTSGTDAYPAALDEGIAAAIMDQLSQPMAPPPEEGDDEAASKLGQEAKRSQVDVDSSGPVEVEAQAAGGDSWEGPTAGWGNPIRCYYKGLFRVIHDGGGLCSPGRWPVDHRRELAKPGAVGVASCCKRLFLQWINMADKQEGGAQATFWQLAGGKSRDSPFARFMPEARRALDATLSALGRNPERRSGDVDTEVNFRRLSAMLDVVEDEDWEWIGPMAEAGVKLGVDETMPRVPKVFEEKTKWNLDFTDEDFRDVLAENYKSAEENSADIRRQVLEEVERGSIIKMALKDAETTYKGRLAVAALGAVPKELGSTTVRVVHDGSYSVDVNHRIKVLDRMRFPMIDDASGVLRHLKEENRKRGGTSRFSLLYDISRAHKLIPVAKCDWGFQAFRLPGQEDEEVVYLHTRGTFGVASAAYHWQRLAACVVRLLHRIAGRELGSLHLLFADDGWLSALGSGFWRRMLFWVFCLDLLEIPLSWKKVRGGLVVQWIGYQIDVDKFLKGISDRKVRWIMEWIEKHLASGYVTGRELKSALGRFCFVAGALPHVRPFLGPLFAWSAVLGQNTCAQLPDAVAVLLQYIQGEVAREPMSPPKNLVDRPREAFRVDAKAEGDCIVVGGWEIDEDLPGKKGRWFSIRLTRKNAPWAYIKGDPFRSITSLELVAVLSAVMLFGDLWKDRSRQNVITLSGTTDNLGNTDVLKHFMSCKFPLSIAVMELAVQLKDKGVELELGWVPRGQNIEADALTNEEFNGFDMSKRILKKFEDMEFVVLDKLMMKASELDEEVRLAKTSKEAKADVPQSVKGKKRKGQTRWEDPW